MISKENLKKALSTTLLISLILSLPVIFINCNDDDEEETPETLAGEYVMQEVTVIQDYTINDVVIIPAGTDVTQVTAEGILSAAPCDNPVNGAVELRDSGQLYLTCIGEDNELAAGTWEENPSLTTLSLNLSNPPFPQNLQLNVTDITRTSTTIEGIINPLILTPDAIEDLLPEGVTAPPAILLAVGIVFAEAQ